MQQAPQRIERDLARETAQIRMRAELEGKFDVGQVEEAVLRALVYIRLSDGSVDERGFTILKHVRDSRPAARRLSLARFKEMLREQFLLVLLDQKRAVAALPKLLGADAAERGMAMDVLHKVLAARGDLSEEGKRRLAEIERLFAARPAKSRAAEDAHA